MRIRSLFPAIVVLFVISSGAFGAGKEATVTGEVIDNYCFLQMGVRGESHRQCGIECARKGMSVALLEDKTNKLYVLLPDKDKTALPEAVIEKMGRKATITGMQFSSGGSQFLTVATVK